MRRLKLFVSHSSKPRPGAEDDEQTLRNWTLLQQTCEELQTRWADKIQLVVDYKDLQHCRRADEWINVSLAECHMAVVLFSERARDDSNWVKQEATILSWRQALDPKGFTLLLVFFDGQTTRKQVVEDDPYFSTLGLRPLKCLTVEADAGKLVSALKSDIEALVARHPNLQTPFDQLVGAVARTLRRAAKADTLEALWQDLFPEKPPPHWRPGKKRAQAFADAFARDLLKREGGHVEHLAEMLDKLRPKPKVRIARDLFRSVRPLWIPLEQAAQLPKARSDGRLLALNGQRVADSNPEPVPAGNPGRFTLDRLCERAWCSDNIEVLGISQADSAREIQKQIRKGYSCNDPRADDEQIDQWINSDGRPIIVFIPKADQLPDCRLLHEIETMRSENYPRTIFIFHVGERMPEPDCLGDLLVPLTPPIEPEREGSQYNAERQFGTLFARIYPGSFP